MPAARTKNSLAMPFMVMLTGFHPRTIISIKIMQRSMCAWAVIECVISMSVFLPLAFILTIYRSSTNSCTGLEINNFSRGCTVHEFWPRVCP